MNRTRDIILVPMTLMGLLWLGVWLGSIDSSVRPAFADNPPQESSPNDKKGSSSPYLGPANLTAADAIICFPTAAGSGVPQLLPYGSQVVIDCDAEAWAFWSQAATEADLSMNTTTGVITDSASGAGVPGDGAAPDGYGNGWHMLSGVPYAKALNKKHFVPGESITVRDGVCENASGRNNGYPCRQDTECTDFSATHTTCDTTVDNHSRVDGAFLCVHVNGTCWANLE